MTYKECERVLLKDGRKGTIMGVWKDGEAYEVEIEDIEGVDYAHECPMETILHKDIEKVIS